MRRQKNESEKDKKKKRQSIIEAELFAIMEKSLKTAVNMALDEIFKDFNKR